MNEMEKINRFDVIVNNGEIFEKAVNPPTNQMIRKEYEDLLEEILADAEDKKMGEIHFKAVEPAESKADCIQKIIFQEGAIIKYLEEHAFPERIRVVCPEDELATMYQMNYNFYYATEKSDRLGIEKWD